MSHHPYPSLTRARRQHDHHVKVAFRRLSDLERFEQGVAILRSAGWTGKELAAHWQRVLRPQSVASKETAA
ncbi:hypothetical protein [Streptomyces sp. NPDC101455]|uniref:hypothetical protein n=1 Tax=Streptomyces sp. NPDC101455 TaxID=3366142 RepID=UPI00382A335B